MDQQRLERLLTSLHHTDVSASVLQRICVVCATTTARDGAGVSRIFDGRHEMVVASDDSAARVEALQVTLSEGPCFEVVESFRPAYEPDLSSTRANDRWPSFTPAARREGLAAAFAFPLLTGGAVIGALDVYSTRSGPLSTDSVEDVMILAGLATLAVERLDAAPQIDGVDLLAETAEPWAYAATVHNATGMIAEQLDIDVEAALLRLRAAAFATDRSVASVARDVVTRQMRLEPWAVDE